MPIFLKIDGVMGDSTDAKHIGWFEVDGFDFGATRPVNTGGEGTGRVAFSPLSVDISSLAGLAPLLGDLTGNKLLKTVELVEVAQKDQTVYDLKLTDAVLASYSNAPGPHGVETGLKFDFKTVSLTDHGVTSDGAGAAETTSATASRFTAGAAVTSETVTPLLGDPTTNNVLKTVDLVDVKQTDQAVYDLKVTNALTLMMQSAAGLPGVETSAAFNFQTGTPTDHGVTSENTLGAPQKAGLNSHPSIA